MFTCVLLWNNDILGQRECSFIFFGIIDMDMLQSSSADDHLVAIKGSRPKKKKDSGRSNLLKLLKLGALSWILNFTSQRLHFYYIKKGSKSPIIASYHNNKLFKQNNKAFSIGRHHSTMMKDYRK